MTPTTKLRFVERAEYVNTDERGNHLPPDTVREVKRRVLQQFWVEYDLEAMVTGEGVWRDVPLEQE